MRTVFAATAALVLVLTHEAYGAQAHPRVIVVSWDGAGYAMTTQLLADGRMPNLARMLEEGAWSDGMVSSFPTKTAAAHAMLFTGTYGHENGITANAVWKLPANEHDRLETWNGFFSTALRADPIWVRAARAGLEAYAVHATQAYPFATAVRDLDAEAQRHLFLIHGYTDAVSSGVVWNEHNAPIETPAGWSVPEAQGTDARAFRFDVEDTDFWGLLFDDPLDPIQGVDTLGIMRDPKAAAFDARVKAGVDGEFSTPVVTKISGRDVWFSVRMFEVSLSGDEYLMYRSGAVELALSNPRTPKASHPVMQVYAGNSGARPYASGALGATRVHGGDGTAEARFQETLAHLQKQVMAQASVVLDEDYSLVVLYSPVSDDVVHVMAGFVDEGLESYDERLAAQYWEHMADGFELQDRYLGLILDAAQRDGSHVILVSDHGITGTDRFVHLNVALEQAGLLTLRPDRSIDLSATRALAPPLNDTSIAVNSTERAGGIVGWDEREDVLDEVRRVLSQLEDPDTGAPIITAFFEPASTGLLQPGGVSTGDLFLEFAPGYYPSESTAGDVVVERSDPLGMHIFVPTRRKMLSICAAWGPRIPAGANLGKVRAIDIVPTVLELLELEVPSSLPGRSLVGVRTLLDAAR